VTFRDLLVSFGTSLAAWLALEAVREPFGLDALAADLGGVLAARLPWLVYGGGS
jgi:hypothetical protein